MSTDEDVSPRHAIRATRTAGRKTRSLLLDAASRLFRDRGLYDCSIADIASAADVFPSQITYYFRTKEALFVEAACRDVLHLAKVAEEAAAHASSPKQYMRSLAGAVTAVDAVAFFAEALTLARRRPNLAPLIERTLDRLHSEGSRAHAASAEARGWQLLHSPAESARRFWAAAIGVVIEGSAIGSSQDEMQSTLLAILGEELREAGVSRQSGLHIVS